MRKSGFLHHSIAPVLVEVFMILWGSESKMLSLKLALLVGSAVEALVLAPPPNLSPDMEQDSVDPLETLSSAVLENASFATITASLPVANSSLTSNDSLHQQVLVRCDDGIGRDLNLQSCSSALSTIDYSDTRQFSWGPRGVGVEYTFPLPR